MHVSYPRYVKQVDTETGEIKLFEVVFLNQEEDNLICDGCKLKLEEQNEDVGSHFTSELHILREINPKLKEIE